MATTTPPISPSAIISFTPVQPNIDKTKVEIVGNQIIATINGERYDVQISDKQFTQFVIGDTSSCEEMRQLVERVADFLKTNNLLNHTNEASVQVSETDISVTQKGATTLSTGSSWDGPTIKAVKDKYEDIIENPLNPYISKHISNNFAKPDYYTLTTYGDGKCGPIAIHDQLHQIQTGTINPALAIDDETANRKERTKVTDYLTQICIHHRNREKVAKAFELPRADIGKLTNDNDVILKQLQASIQQDLNQNEIPEASKKEYSHLASTDIAKLSATNKAKILRYWSARERAVRAKVIFSVEEDNGKGIITDPSTQSAINKLKLPAKDKKTFDQHTHLSDEEIFLIYESRAAQYKTPNFWARQDFLEISAHVNKKIIAIISTNEKGIPFISETYPNKILDTQNVKLADIIFIRSNGIINSKTSDYIINPSHFESVNRTKTDFLKLLINRTERSRIDQYAENLKSTDKDKLPTAFINGTNSLSTRSMTKVEETLTSHEGEFLDGVTINPDKFHKFATEHLNANQIWGSINHRHSRVRKYTSRLLSQTNSKTKTSTSTPVSTSSTTPLSPTLASPETLDPTVKSSLSSSSGTTATASSKTRASLIKELADVVKTKNFKNIHQCLVSIKTKDSILFRKIKMNFTVNGGSGNYFADYLDNIQKLQPLNGMRYLKIIKKVANSL
jgi:hypothetical protein